jgi:hypothetical protein
VSLVVKKVSYSIALRFPVFDVDVSKEVTESELRQFYGELKRLEAAVGEQLGTFASMMNAPVARVQVSKENVMKILQYAEGKQLFKAADVEVDLGFSRNVAYNALSRLVVEKKLTRLKLPRGAYGYSLIKKVESVPTVDVECEEAKFIREDLKRLNAAEVQARHDSR